MIDKICNITMMSPHHDEELMHFHYCGSRSIPWERTGEGQIVPITMSSYNIRASDKAVWGRK